MRHRFGIGSPFLWTLSPPTGTQGLSPGFLDLAVVSPAGVVLDVNPLPAADGGEIQVANLQEMRPQAPDGHFGNVCEGLADGTAENEAAHLLVERCHVGVLDKGVRLLLQVVDAVQLSRDDLWGSSDTEGLGLERGKKNLQNQPRQQDEDVPSCKPGETKFTLTTGCLMICSSCSEHLKPRICCHSEESLVQRLPPPDPPHLPLFTASQEEITLLKVSFIENFKKKLDFGLACLCIFTELK